MTGTSLEVIFLLILLFEKYVKILKYFSGAWGKREQMAGWNNLKGLWGKRSKNWSKLNSSWGKRNSQNMYDNLY